MPTKTHKTARKTAAQPAPKQPVVHKAESPSTNGKKTVMTIIAVEGQVLKIDTGDGEESRVIAADARITLDGARVALADLKPGDEVLTSGDQPCISVAAKRS